MARILAVSNQKGGVGKTTTAVNLSAALAAIGQKTLLVDLDPQGNATSGVGFPRGAVERSVYDAMVTEEEPASFVIPTEFENLDLLPATRSLVGAELELVDMRDRERCLRGVLNTLRDDYDWILIDCPPSLGLLTINALVAADGVLIPLQAEYYALEGMSELIRTISMVRKRLNPDLVREGVVLTMNDTRNNLCRAVEEDAREMLGHEVFATSIPRNVRLGEAPSYGKPIVTYDNRSSGAKAYRSLALEIVGRRAGRQSAIREAS